MGLLVPLAMPTYIVAYTYVDFLSLCRAAARLAARKSWAGRRRMTTGFPEIRSMGGAIVVLALVLYPYVFLTARASFLRQIASQLEVARTLGAQRLGRLLLGGTAAGTARPSRSASASP